MVRETKTEKRTEYTRDTQPSKQCTLLNGRNCKTLL